MTHACEFSFFQLNCFPNHDAVLSFAYNNFPYLSNTIKLSRSKRHGPSKYLSLAENYRLMQTKTEAILLLL